MSEQLQRTESVLPLHEIAITLAQEIGERPEQRLRWLMQQTGESFGDVLLYVNSIARGLDPEGHSFDGEGVQAGTTGASIPPDHEDKIILLGELVSAAQRHIAMLHEKGEDHQTIVSKLAVAVPTVVNKLHLFADGNGRTSRLLRMVLRDGDQLTTEKTEALVHKSGYEKYDTTPGHPIETSILRHMRDVNGTSEIDVIDDVVSEDIIADEIYEYIGQKFSHISPGVIKAYLDVRNFSETVRLMAKNKGAGTASLSELFQ